MCGWLQATFTYTWVFLLGWFLFSWLGQTLLTESCWSLVPGKLSCCRVMILFIFFFSPLFKEYWEWFILVVVLVIKNPPANARDAGSVPESGRSPGGGNGNPLQYSCQENPVDKGACRATAHGVAKSWTWLCLSSSILYKTAVILERKHVYTENWAAWLDWAGDLYVVFLGLVKWLKKFLLVFLGQTTEACRSYFRS